ncbi:MAG: hypothetical protein ACK5C5_05965 [Bacteroidota bacterium]|jgi:hypothetical protein
MSPNSPNNQSLFPVFKFNLEKKLVEANRASAPLLEKWGWKLNESLPSRVVSQHPQLFHCILSQTPADISVSMDGFQIHFSIVPFPEAGYIGMYAYSLESESGLARTVAPAATANVEFSIIKN